MYPQKKVMVHLKTIESINSSSGSYVYSTNTLKIPSLDLKSSSGSEMKLSVDTKKISGRSSSGAVMKLEGHTKDFVGKSSSGSQINASKLIADFCDILKMLTNNNTRSKFKKKYIIM